MKIIKLITKNTITKRAIQVLLVLTSIYVLLIVRGGYEYGRNDSMQLSYSVFLHDNTLYPSDLYIQEINTSIPNERYFFSSLLSIFSNLKYITLIGHFIMSLLLFFAVDKITSLYIKKIEGFKWFVQIFLFIILYDINIGGNELYYNNFFVSLISKTIGLWAVYYILKNKYLLSFVLISLSTFFHPIVGVQLFIIFSVIILAGVVIKRNYKSIKKFVLPVLFYLLTAGVWLVWLKLNFADKQLNNDEEFFNIFFKFRNSHHYMPSYFPLKSYLILVPLNIFGLIYFYKKEIKLFIFYITVIIISLIFTIGVEVFHSVEIASFQWFKSTIWLKLFSIIAVFAFMEKYFLFLTKKIFVNIYKSLFFALSVICLSLILFNTELLPFNVNFDFGKQLQNDKAVAISLDAKKLTNKDALFVQPLRFTELKFYAQRSSFVDYKIPVHRKAAINKWYKRVELLYNLDYKAHNKTYNINSIADKYYTSLNEDFFKDLADKNQITHVLTFKEHNLDFKVISKNDLYKIYEIN